MKEIQLHNVYGSARIAQKGATLISWIPNGMEDIIWLSPYSSIEDNKPIRGGIPVCFPWFGPNRQHSNWPLHGFVRDKEWRIIKITNKHDYSEAILEIESKEIDNKFGYGDFHIQIKFELNRQLRIGLSIQNLDIKEFSFEVGLHTYFKANPSEVVFPELLGKRFYDKIDGYKLKTNTEPLVFKKEEERADFYMDMPDSFCMYLKNKTITLRNKSFDSLVFWNPGEINGNKNIEIQEYWNSFVCMESANCLDNKLTLAPGQEGKYEIEIEILEGNK